MSKRVDIENQTFGYIHVLVLKQNENILALYQCLCMYCNLLMYVTFSNLINKNTKSCVNKITNYKQECKIIEEYSKYENIYATAKKFKISRQIIYKVIRDYQNGVNNEQSP